MQQLRLSLVQVAANPFAKNASVAFSEANILHEVITTLAYDPTGAISSYLDHTPEPIRNTIKKELGRRIWTLPNNGKICTHSKNEVFRLALLKTRLFDYLGFDTARLTDWVAYSLDQHVSKAHLGNINAIYSYEDVAATTFSAAKKLNIRCLYDLAIMFYKTSQSIQTEESELFPCLAPALAATREPKWKLERKEQEIELADHIYVASSVTYRSLVDNGIEPKKITIIPYGSPVAYFNPRIKPDKIFRAVFVGQITPRKGVHYLLQAWKELHLPEAELMLVGTDFFPKHWLHQYEEWFTHIDSVPHASLQMYYTFGSVFVFPSLVEGFGMVLLEAMACGLPIITTPNTAGPDIITDGIEGFIVPIRDTEALKEKLEWCYQNPEALAEMGRSARRKAEELTWNLYRQNLVSHVMKHIESQ